MTKEEYNEAAALVVRLRKELEHTNQHLVAHIDALTKSNAQCGEYLRRNEQLHSELVEVRAALAATTEQRDSLQRTLDEWERGDTKPHERVTADDVADHVVPPVVSALMDEMNALATHTICGQPSADQEPEPPNHEYDEGLEFRNGVPTPEMISACQWWDLVGSETAICFKNKDQRPVVWRYSVHSEPIEWQYTDCPQPLKPHGMTWQQLDAVLASKKAAESTAAPVPAAELPLCNVCHECGSELINCSQGTNHHDCPRPLCPRTCTGRHGGGFSPYTGPCKSGTPVRHE